jgi:beta-xylosidase
MLKNIDILSRIETDDNQGGYVVTYNTVSSSWADVIAMNELTSVRMYGRIINDGKVLHCTKDIDNSHVIAVDGNNYYILSKKHHKHYKFSYVLEVLK